MMLTDAELRDLRVRHKSAEWVYGGQVCAEESEDAFATDWPCDASRLLDEVERLREALAQIEALDQTVHGLVIGNIARAALAG